jgi:hypothetical protein
MTNLQILAFIVLPAFIALVGYVAVLRHEHKRRQLRGSPQSQARRS